MDEMIKILVSYLDDPFEKILRETFEEVNQILKDKLKAVITRDFENWKQLPEEQQKSKENKHKRKCPKNSKKVSSPGYLKKRYLRRQIFCNCIHKWKHYPSGQVKNNCFH